MSSQTSFGNRVFISGLTAAGKTTHSKHLAEHFSCQYISSSNALLEMLGVRPDVVKSDFWISEQASKLQEMRKDPSFDRRVDMKMATLVSKNQNIVVDSWAISWVSKESAFKIWLESSLESRIWKSMISHGLPKDRSYNQYQKLLLEKDESTRELFLKEYSFDLFTDHSHFDFVIDITSFITGPTFEASRMSVNLVNEILVSAVGSFIYGEVSYKKDFLRLYNQFASGVFKKSPLLL